MSKPDVVCMDIAISQAYDGIKHKHGGPFGAVVSDKKGNIISEAHNTVLKDHDPTCHGEINAIRSACNALGTHDLSGCILYTTAYPCPMCLSACMWANIEKIYYGCTKEDTDKIGFRDDKMYDVFETHLDKLYNKKRGKYTVQYLHNRNLDLFINYMKTEHDLY